LHINITVQEWSARSCHLCIQDVGCHR